MNNWYRSVSWDMGGENLASYLSLLELQGITQANLTHRLPDAREISLLATLPNSLNWSIHLSAGTLGSSTEALEQYHQALQDIPPPRELLVVSGNPAPKRDSFALTKLVSDWNIPLALAVSPHDSAERIAAKCEVPGLSRIYLQFCSEPEVWDETLATIRKYAKAPVSACWLVPSKANWSALKLFPWKGSLLSPMWQESFEYAQTAAQKQLDWMQRSEVTPLVEPRKLSEKSFEIASNYSYTEGIK